MLLLMQLSCFVVAIAKNKIEYVFTKFLVWVHTPKQKSS